MQSKLFIAIRAAASPYERETRDQSISRLESRRARRRHANEASRCDASLGRPPSAAVVVPPGCLSVRSPVGACATRIAPDERPAADGEPLTHARVNEYFFHSTAPWPTFQTEPRSGRVVGMGVALLSDTQWLVKKSGEAEREGRSVSGMSTRGGEG